MKPYKKLKKIEKERGFCKNFPTERLVEIFRLAKKLPKILKGFDVIALPDGICFTWENLKYYIEIEADTEDFVLVSIYKKKKKKGNRKLDMIYSTSMSEKEVIAFFPEVLEEYEIKKEE